MNLFTTDEINELTSNIELFHVLYLAENGYADVLSKEDKRLLKLNEIDLAKYKGKTSYSEYSYYFGKLESTRRERILLRKIKFPQYKAFVKQHKEKLALTKADREAILTLKQQTYNDVKRLCNDIKSDFIQDLLETSKTQRLKVERVLRKQIKGKAVTEDIISQLNSKLVKQTKKWIMRFGLISSYRMHEAYQNGVLHEILGTYGAQVKVYYHLKPDACEHCKRVYLREGGLPKIFYLQALINNGSNIGRKAKEYKPSTSPIHPRCRCKMVIYPSRTGRDIKWNKWTRRYERKFH